MRTPRSSDHLSRVLTKGRATEDGLSADRKISCDHCHGPNKGFTDHLPTSMGINNQLGRRNAPTILNAFTGYNSNVPGHEHGKIRYLVYNGGSPKYVSKITEVAENDYEGIAFATSSSMI